MPEGFSGFIDRFLGIKAENNESTTKAATSNANFDQPVHNTTLAGISNSKDNQASSNREPVKGWREILDNSRQTFIDATGIPEPIDVVEGIQNGDFTAVVIGAAGIVTKKLKAGQNLIEAASKAAEGLVDLELGSEHRYY